MATSSRPKRDRAVRAAKPKAPVKRAQSAKPAATAGSEQAPRPAAEALALPAGAPAAAEAMAALPEPLDPPAPVAVTAENGKVGAPPSAPEPVAERTDHPKPEPRPVAAAAADEGRTIAPVVEPEAEPGAHEIPSRPLAVPDLTVMLGAGRTLVEGALLARGQMIGFTYRQAEQSLAASRAMFASGSLPEALALQTKYLGRALDDALTQTLELSRLSTDLVRAGLQALRPH